MWLLGLRGRELRERWRRAGYNTHGAIVKRVRFTTIIVVAGAAREAGGLAHGRAREKAFPSNSCLIRYISSRYISSRYIERLT